MSLSKLNLKKLIWDVFFPPVCVNCKKHMENQGDFLCGSCFDHIQINSSFYCAECGARQTTLKKNCHKNSLYTLAPATFFNEPVPALIHFYKYEKLKEIEKILGAILIAYLKSLKIDFSKFAIIPVPLHPLKKLERGFNQAGELANIISKNLSIPALQNAVIRTKYAKPQANIKDYSERKENIKSSFKIISPDKIKNKNIIVIDDVSTSGSTMEEISKELKNSGARKIIALVVAKA